ncbi:MAG: hypothetical protein QG639_26 [Patescibacteria group bacterium]|jgi:hypothetical protein|nr:hypothetical protein [Patescibacteria group bacterium]
MYLHHHVPENQKGDIIYPLSLLKEKFPNIYKEQFAKYDNIKEKDVEIPGFGYWNDCVNLMPVSPGLVKKELEKYGHNTDWKWKFYRINPEILDKSKLIIMVMDDDKGTLERKFIPFSSAAFERYCHIGEPTRTIFQKAKENNEQPNTYARVPHVLYRDSINTKDLEVIEF